MYRVLHNTLYNKRLHIVYIRERIINYTYNEYIIHFRIHREDGDWEDTRGGRGLCTYIYAQIGIHIIYIHF